MANVQIKDDLHHLFRLKREQTVTRLNSVNAPGLDRTVSRVLPEL